ncbi:VWA domain-containing protein [Streptomyces sp. NPDC003435]
MGILSLLRNAFGRGRKGRPDEAESADQLPTPRQEHDLVTAAFDTPRVPAQGAVREGSEPPKADGTATPEAAGATTPETATPEAADATTPEAETAPAPTSPEAQAPAAPEAPSETETPEPQTAPASEVEKPETETPAPVESADTATAPESRTSAETETAAPKAESAPEPEAPASAETAPSAEALASEKSAEADATAAPETAAPTAETPVAAEPETAEAPEEKAAEPDPLATAAPEIEPLMMEPAIIDADPEVVVPQQRTEPLPEAEAEHDQPAIPEQSTEPPADALTEPEAPESTPVAEAEVEAKPTPEPEATTAADAGTETKPEAEPEAKAPAEPEPDIDAKPKAEIEPKPTAEPTAKPEPKVEAKPEAKPEPEAKAEPVADAKPKAKVEPEPEAKPEAKAAPEAATTPAPEAADAPAPPQAAPAPDNASRTGGAGGNTTEAEGEAEAEPLLTAPPSLTTAHTAAAATLTKTNLTTQTAKLYLVLDRSSSMRPYYRDGSAQALADQTLALAAHLDKDPTVHVVFFSTEVDGTTDLTLTEDHTTKIDETHASLGRMGRTSYHAAVEAVLAHHDKHHTPEDNALVVFQTDGAPDAKTPATLALTNAAKSHPKVFFSFVAFGDPDSKAFDYLRRLRTANTSFFHAGPTPRELTDTELYEGVLAAWRP